METFAIQHLTFTYPKQTAPALRALSLTVERGAFFVLCGPSGCGKTTLLRQLKPAMAPHGHRTGTVLFEGAPLESLSFREQSGRIGFVQQSPENQIVTDKVWHELAFGLESLGLDTPSIRRRVAEIASFFGIQDWFGQSTGQLSGGQKQLLNLASVMVMQPSVLILDEPTSQLDPIAAAEFLGVLGRLNRELGTTILLTEHRLEDALPLATRAAVLDRGSLLCAGSPSEIGAALRDRGHSMFCSMPAPMRVWAAAGRGDAPCPVTVREGRDWLEGLPRPLRPLPEEPVRAYPQPPVIQVRELWFRYGQELPDVVRGLSLEVGRGEFLALLGGNGAGKSTALSLLSGLNAPYRGERMVRGRVGVLPQNPQSLFLKPTVREELLELDPQPDRAARTAALCRLSALLERHPHDLSGGEQQRLALAKILLVQPDILLLDEPTKGMDAAFKQSFGELLRQLLREGKTILMVSHDLEFCAQYAHRCALLFHGSIAAEGTPRSFFAQNEFYTTAANRMARSAAPQVVTVEELIHVCGGTPSLPPPPLEERAPLPVQAEPPPLSRRRRLGAILSGGLALVLFLRFLGTSDLTALVGQEGMTALSRDQLRLYACLVAALLVLAGCVSRRSPRERHWEQVPRHVPLSTRTKAAAALTLLLVPLTLAAGQLCPSGRNTCGVAVLVLLECMAPFFLVFEGRRPRARELVVIAVLCAIALAGRAAFFMLPQFKPVMAVTILAGTALGGETGFLVGAMSMLTSNLLFSQGPWTPWQMFAMGLTGFLAGVLFHTNLLRPARESLCVFGALCAILVYGGIMNPASALIWTGSLDRSIVLAYWLTGFPFDCVHAAATWLFLWFAGEPMLEKLERVKVKYGL